jgi:hypothetical protein
MSRNVTAFPKTKATGFTFCPPKIAHPARKHVTTKRTMAVGSFFIISIPEERPP